jgi:hypothetical protein
MFKSLKKSVTKSDNEKPTDDQASTFSYATTLKPGDTSGDFMKPDATQKDKMGMLAKLAAKKDALVEKLEEVTLIGRSNAMHKKLKEAGDTDKGPGDNNPTYPVMYVV